MFNIDNYRNCKKNNTNYFYSYFKYEENQIELKAEESFIFKYDPKNPNAITDGSEKGYYKDPYINFQHEARVLTTLESMYRMFAELLKKHNKNFTINCNKYKLITKFYLSFLK